MSGEPFHERCVTEFTGMNDSREDWPNSGKGDRFLKKERAIWASLQFYF